MAVGFAGTGKRPGCKNPIQCAVLRLNLEADCAVGGLHDLIMEDGEDFGKSDCASQADLHCKG